MEAVNKKTKKVQQKLEQHKQKGDNLDKYFDDSVSDGDSSDDSFDEKLGDGAKATGGADPSKLIDFELIKLLQYCKILA